MKSDPRGRRALVATFVVFISCGLVMSTWASRIPQLKIALDMEPAAWGLVLLAMAMGSMTSLPISGLLISRFGEKSVVRYAALLTCVSLSTIGLGYVAGVAPVIIGLYLMGAGLGCWDVAMNVQGTKVEHRLMRVIMPRFHAGYSVGTVGGALLGALLIHLDVGIAVNLVLVAVLVGVAVLFQVRNFITSATEPLDDPETIEEAAVQAIAEETLVAGAPLPSEETAGEPAAGERATQGRLSLGQAWVEPRTLIIGLSVMIFGFTEGTAIDWIGVALVEDYHTSASLGTLGLATFLAMMTLSRWFGTVWLERFGRVAVLRVQAAVGFVGVLLFVLPGILPLAFLGVALWGFGASLGFPVGMSAGGDDQANSAVRVSVIATIGYIAGLAGPPLVGLIGQNVGVLWALTLVAALLPVAFGLAGVMAQPKEPGGKSPVSA